MAASMLATARAMMTSGGAKGKKNALELLTNYLTRDNKSNTSNPSSEVFEFVVNLAAENEWVHFITSVILSQTKKLSPLSFSYLQNDLMFCVKAGKSVIDRAVAKMGTANQQKSVEEAIFLTMTGMSAEERCKQCFMDPAFQFFMTICNGCLTAIEKNSKFELLYQEILRFGLELCRQHQRSYEMNVLNGKLTAHLFEIFNENKDLRSHRHIKDAAGRKSQRDVIASSSELISSIIQTKRDQTNIANETRDWKGAVDVMRSVRLFVANLRKLEKTVKMGDLCPVWELEAEVLFAAGNVPFHAFQAVSVAKSRIFELGTEDDTAVKALASQAVLAVLCVPDTQLATSDEGSDRLMQLAKTLQMIAPPTREGLLGDLERPGRTAGGHVATLLSLAFPFVRDLYNLFVSVPTIEVCEKAAPLLKQITDQSPQLARYSTALEAVAVRNMLGIMSRCFCAVGIDDFVRRCGGLFKADGSDFATRVEPLLLKESYGNQTKIVVDFGTRQIIFLPNVVAAENLIAFQSAFAGHVAEVTREAYSITSTTSATSTAANATAAAKKQDAATAEAKSLMDKIQESRLRILSRHVICKQRVENFAHRIEQLHAAEKKRREDDLDERGKKEEAKRLVAKQKADEKVQKIIDEEKAVERRKWAVNAINARHKTANVPLTLAAKNDAEFLVDASKLLLKAMRAADTSRKDDTKTMDYYERAAREVEIPLRKQWFEVQSQEFHEMRKLQAENLRKEQEREQAASKLKQEKLLRLLPQKEAFERRVLATAARVTGTSKADAQEDDMARMMREREEAAAARKK